MRRGGPAAAGQAQAQGAQARHPWRAHDRGRVRGWCEPCGFCTCTPAAHRRWHGCWSCARLHG
eukprot:scaffold147387_cov19-Tisochrysis_lutea.AAC.1